MVCGNEIDRHLVFSAKLDHFRNPRVVGGGRTAYPQTRIYCLDCFCRHAVQLKVVLHGACKETIRRIRAAKIGLIPHLKEPLAHFRASIPVQQMLHKSPDKPGPLIVICRRRRVSLIVEYGGRLALQALRHKAQLHERLHVDGKQEIKDAVYVGERKPHLLAVIILHHHTHIIVKKAVEAHVAKADFPLALFQLLTVVLPQRRSGMAASHAKLPVLFQRFYRRIYV